MKKIVVAVLVGLALGSIGVANAAGYKIPFQLDMPTQI
ncbi:hypothetical protein SEEC0006_13057 [Salmonella enterica subsp. enterica serovar Choleraesuis str. 0006]|nr:hypothetical protein SEEC0006_13057 [Salmonella enterica subsp. enterica serovar Choleraesuis str. 0006]